MKELNKLFEKDDKKETMNWNEVKEKIRIPHDKKVTINWDHMDVSHPKNIEVLNNLKSIVMVRLVFLLCLMGVLGRRLRAFCITVK